MIDWSERHEANAAYMPTPEKIAEECAEIRAGWSEAERGRKGLASKVDGERWNLPVCREELQ